MILAGFHPEARVESRGHPALQRNQSRAWLGAIRRSRASAGICRPNAAGWRPGETERSQGGIAALPLFTLLRDRRRSSPYHRCRASAATPGILATPGRVAARVQTHVGGVHSSQASLRTNLPLNGFGERMDSARCTSASRFRYRPASPGGREKGPPMAILEPRYPTLRRSVERVAWKERSAFPGLLHHADRYPRISISMFDRALSGEPLVRSNARS